MKTSEKLCIFAVTCFAVFAGYSAASNWSRPKPKLQVIETIRSFCGDQPEAARKIREFWTNAGVVKAHSGLRIEVEDSLWAAIPHDAKVSIGLAYSCLQHDRTILVRGHRDGALKGAVTNGQ
jgi:hypothetical protein